MPLRRYLFDGLRRGGDAHRRQEYDAFDGTLIATPRAERKSMPVGSPQHYIAGPSYKVLASSWPRNGQCYCRPLGVIIGLG